MARKIKKEPKTRTMPLSVDEPASESDVEMIHSSVADSQALMATGKKAPQISNVSLNDLCRLYVIIFTNLPQTIAALTGLSRENREGSERALRRNRAYRGR